MYNYRRATIDRDSNHLNEPLLKHSRIDIIGASWLLPMSVAPDDSESQSIVIENGAIAFQDGRIIDIGDYESLLETHANSAHEAHHDFLDEHILLPGLINNHGHLAMTLLRGYADDLALSTWLESHIWPAEAEWVSDDFVLDGSMLAMAEMLLSGTTTATDMYFFPEASAKAAQLSGIRTNIFFPVMEFPSAWGSGPDEYLEKGLALRDLYKQEPLINIGLGPHAPYTVSDQSFEKVAMYSAELDAPLQIHLHETEKEILDSIEQYGCRPLERLKNLGVLNQHSQLVHATQLTDSEIESIKTLGSSVIHCPQSNLKLASGFAPISKLRDKGVPIGIGTDSAASNNSLDLFEEIRTSALINKYLSGDAAASTSYTALYEATMGGAQASGLAQQIGSLETGKLADFIAVDTANIRMQPMHNPISQLVHTAAGHAINHSWVQGNKLVDNGELTQVDPSELIDKAQHWRQKMA